MAATVNGWASLPKYAAMASNASADTAPLTEAWAWVCTSMATRPSVRMKGRAAGLSRRS